MRISDWSSDVCSSDLANATRTRSVTCRRDPLGTTVPDGNCSGAKPAASEVAAQYGGCSYSAVHWSGWSAWSSTCSPTATRVQSAQCRRSDGTIRSEEHTSELQSLMRTSYAVFCLKKKQKKN